MKSEILIHRARASRSFFLSYASKIRTIVSRDEWSTLLRIHNLSDQEVSSVKPA